MQKVCTALRHSGEFSLERASRRGVALFFLFAAACGCSSIPADEDLPRWKLVQPTMWGAQCVFWSGDGAFEGVGPGAGISTRTSLICPAGAVAGLYTFYGIYWLGGLCTYFETWDPADLPEELATGTFEWVAGAGIVFLPGVLVLVAEDLLESLDRSDKSETGLPSRRRAEPKARNPFLGSRLSPGLLLFPEAGLEYSEHVDAWGDPLGSLRWLVGVRLQTLKGDRPWEAYGTFGLMIAEMLSDVRADSVTAGLYAGAGLSWRIAGGEPVDFALYAECRGGFLRDENDQSGSSVALGAGVSFRWKM